MPKSRTIIRLHSHLSAGLTPHGIICHYKSDKQLLYNVLIRCIFAPSEYDRGKNALRRNRNAASVAQQSDGRWILCSNEQSKLCFRQTKTILSDGNSALRGRAEIFASKSQFRKKRNTNPNIRRMEKTNVTRTDRKPRALKKSLSSRFFPVET
jgi:hypothetical protein